MLEEQKPSVKARPMSRKKRAVMLGIAILLSWAMVLMNAFWVCFAYWMTAYYSDPDLIRVWQNRFCWWLAALLGNGAIGVYFVVEAVRFRRQSKAQ